MLYVQPFDHIAIQLFDSYLWSNFKIYSTYLQRTVILEGASFLTGGVVLAVVLTATCLGVIKGVVVVGTEAGAVEGEVTAGFPAVEVVMMGAEFTNTGSVEGIGLPSLV